MSLLVSHGFVWAFGLKGENLINSDYDKFKWNSHFWFCGMIPSGRQALKLTYPSSACGV